MINLTSTQLRKAASIQDQIEALTKELNGLLGSSAPVNSAAKPSKKKGGMSAAGRAKIAAAQKARWAKIKGAKASPKPAQKKKGKMSAAGRARIVAAQKARWAKINAAKPVAAKPAKKKFVMSAAAKAKIGAAARARWAKIRAAKK